MPKCIITEMITKNIPSYIIVKPTSVNNDEEVRQEIFTSPETNQCPKSSLSSNESSFFDPCNYKLRKRSDFKSINSEYSKLYFIVLGCGLFSDTNASKCLKRNFD